MNTLVPGRFQNVLSEPCLPAVEHVGYANRPKIRLFWNTRRCEYLRARRARQLDCSQAYATGTGMD